MAVRIEEAETVIQAGRKFVHATTAEDKAAAELELKEALADVDRVIDLRRAPGLAGPSGTCDPSR